MADKGFAVTRSQAAHALVRVALGTMFLLFGVGKLSGGIGVFADGLTQAFANTWLPPMLVRPFALALPILEVLIGTALLATAPVAGIGKDVALCAAALTMLALLAGTVVLGNTTAVAQNVFYIVVIAGLLAIDPASSTTPRGHLLFGRQL